MKTALTTEQTQHLLELGVPKERASIKEDMYGPALFKLTDILEILPNKISYNHDNCFLMIIRDVFGNYYVGYAFETFDGPTFCNGCEFGGELIDALYELTVWCVKNKLIVLTTTHH